ncbi:MAG: XRE family transcriptional regulator [Magnetococcales bacterium]|nr:XRE family transcriptional regulator [Magnetococcales bacterium]MBF0439832.1 XRE family transcriptional regulator [Magnetococcales bacterium]
MNRHKGGSLDSFLEEEGVLDEVSVKAGKRLLVLQLADIMKRERINKSHLARELNTSRSQVDRLLDPKNTAITLESMEQLAHAVGRELRVEFV